MASALFLIALCLSSGCRCWNTYVHNGFKVGPNYSPPPARVETQWIDADDPAVRPSPLERDAWWTLFNDPVLNKLIVQARYENLSLREACWRIQEARAQRGIAVGELFPQQQQFTADYARRETSATVANQLHQQRFFDDWATGLRLSWELDFWGRYRRAVEAASAQLEASIANYHDVLVMLQADVAFDYVRIRTFDARLVAARQNLVTQQGSLDIAQQRFRRGVATELDVAQATVNVEQSRARIRQLEITRRQTANRLSILLGTPPHDLSDILGTSQAIPTAPPQVAIGIPAQLLRRRPDVRRSERELAAQSARIGIAASALLPHISINGNIGFESSEFSELFNSQSMTGSIGPSLRWDILNYGRLVNAIRVEDARFKELFYRYQNTVLTAQQEAEDALVAFLRSQLRLKDFMASAKASKRAVELAVQQYQAGLTDFNRVYTLELALSNDEDLLAQAQGDVPQNLILLYKALGGGWRVCTQELVNPPPGTNGPTRSDSREGRSLPNAPPVPTAPK